MTSIDETAHHHVQHQNGIDMSSEEARLARERRMAKIKAGGASRLSKITGRDESPVVSTARSSPAPVRQPSHDDDPPIVSPGFGTTDTDAMSPLMQMLSGNDMPGQGDVGNPMDFMALLNQQLSGELPKEASATSSKGAQPPVPEWQRARRDLGWEIVHLVLSILVGLYVALFNPYGLVLVFATTQCAIQAARLLLGHKYQARAMSMLAPFIGMLPAQYRRLVNDSTTIFHMLRFAYRDFSIVLVVYGLASLGAHQHARPV